MSNQPNSQGFQNAIKAVADAHGNRFAGELRPLLQNYAASLSAHRRTHLLSELSKGTLEKRYQFFSEIAMHAYLLRHFRTVGCPDQLADFYLPSENTFIEVVTPSAGEDPEMIDFTSDYKSDSGARGVPCDAIVRRHWDVISAKASHFAKRSVPDGHAIVVAVSTILLSHFPQMSLGLNDYTFPYIVRAVFPVGGGIFWIDPETGEEGTGHAHQPFVESIRGKHRPKSLFCDAGHSQISAVVAFAPGDDWFGDWQSITIRNPYAINPIAPNFFPNSIARYEIDILENKHRVRRVK